jgi:hypothetical protein
VSGCGTGISVALIVRHSGRGRCEGQRPPRICDFAKPPLYRAVRSRIIWPLNDTQIVRPQIIHGKSYR